MNLLNHGGSCGHSCCLRVEHLGVKIGNEPILTDVNLHIHCGELAAIIGPNGAGKSTFLKAVLSQIDHSGLIAFSEPGQRSRRPRIGYVPQTPSFDPGEPLSVADLFTCCMSRRPAFLGRSAVMEETIRQCLERVHRPDLKDKRIGTLSGGELQRVLLALALEPMPNILLLDEPLSGVDVDGITLLMDMLDEIRREYDLSILMTTHDFSTLQRYADQVILIDGTVLAQGSPEEVLTSDAFGRTFHFSPETQKGGSVR